jgi:hypothetical protein
LALAALGATETVTCGAAAEAVAAGSLAAGVEADLADHGVSADWVVAGAALTVTLGASWVPRLSAIATAPAVAAPSPSVPEIAHVAMVRLEMFMVCSSRTRTGGRFLMSTTKHRRDEGRPRSR